MKTTASHGGETASTGSVVAKDPSGELTVPIRDELSGVESIALGFRQSMFDVIDGDEEIGGVSTGGGFGTDAIILRWGDRTALVRGSELLKAWVAEFDPEAAAQFPEAVR